MNNISQESRHFNSIADYGSSYTPYKHETLLQQYLNNPLLLILTVSIIEIYFLYVNTGIALLVLLVVVISSGLKFNRWKLPPSNDLTQKETYVSPNISPDGFEFETNSNFDCCSGCGDDIIAGSIYCKQCGKKLLV